MGSGLGLSSHIEEQHQACTSLHYSQLKKKVCCNKTLMYYVQKKKKMDVKEDNAQLVWNLPVH